MTGTLPRGVQANHLNQFAAYRSTIRRNDGLAVAMRGDALNEAGTPHYLFHQSLETFWDRYRGTTQKPTNAEYDVALHQALRDAGFSEDDAAHLVAHARNERTRHGLSQSNEVPRVPGRMPQH
jgi:hypothetical protein